MQKSQKTQKNMNNFNIDGILNDVNSIVKTGINRILIDYVDRYNLLEETHSQIMKLPSVLNELKLYSYAFPSRVLT